MRRVQKGGLSEKILTYLAETTKDLLKIGVRIVIDPNSFTKGFSLYYTPPPLVSRSRRQRLTQRRLIQKKIYFLKRRGYIKTTKKTWELTSKGRAEIIKVILQKKLQEKKWDGKWRVIIFDIPEMRRRDRDFLRRELKWIGFIELQKSVWVFPYNTEEEIIALLRLWELEFKGDIRFLVAERISGEETLRKQFGSRLE